MIRFYLFNLAVLLSFCCSAQDIWINEIHYDNVGQDTLEGFEIAGPAGFNLDGFQVELINGSNGSVYNTVMLGGEIIDNGNGLGTVWYEYEGLQNGAADGLVIVDTMGAVVQFLSYEGELIAAEGAAMGMTSTDIGVEEAPSEINNSLQLIGNGNRYSDFEWMADVPATRGADNNGQVLPTTELIKPKLIIFPNPVADGVLKVKLETDRSEKLLMYNGFGEKLSEYDFIGTDFELDLSSFRSGVYYLMTDKSATVNKIVVE